MTTHQIAKQWLSFPDITLSENHFIPALEYVPGSNDSEFHAITAERDRYRSALMTAQNSIKEFNSLKEQP